MNLLEGSGLALVSVGQALPLPWVRAEISAYVQTLGGLVLGPIGLCTLECPAPQAGAGLMFSPLWLRGLLGVSDHSACVVEPHRSWGLFLVIVHWPCWVLVESVLCLQSHSGAAFLHVKMAWRLSPAIL